MLLFLLFQFCLGQWSSVLLSIFPDPEEYHEVLAFLQKTGFQPEDIAEMPSALHLKEWGLKPVLAWKLYQSQKSVPEETPSLVSSNPLIKKNLLAPGPSPLLDGKCKLSRRFWSSTQQQLRDPSTVLVSVTITSNTCKSLLNPNFCLTLVNQPIKRFFSSLRM